jgi:predicted DNA-binding ArsR family transcriptional regulator
MAITHTYTINNKYLEGDALVTDISVQFSGDFTDLVDIVIYHFLPQSVEEVEANVESRIVTEKEKILARQVTEQVLNDL